MFFFSEKTSKEKRKVQQRKVAERRVVDGFWQDGVGVWGAEASVPEDGLLEDQVGGDWNSFSNLSILNCQEILRQKDSWKPFLEINTAEYKQKLKNVINMMKWETILKSKIYDTT